MTISDAIKDKAVQAYREGLHTIEVAALCGISRQVLDKWRREGADGNGPHGTFAREAAAAEAEHVRDTIRVINGSRASDPNLALKYLQADPKTRDRYGQRTDTSHDAAAAALAFLASRLPPPPPAAALPAIDAPLLEERTRTHEDTRVELDGRDVTDTG